MTHRRFRTPLKQVFGLGSGGSGTPFWIAQRLSALLFLVSSTYVGYGILGGHFLTRAHFLSWIHTPIHRAVVLLALVTMGWHLALGLQVVVEDYIPNHHSKMLGIFLIRGLILFLTLVGIVALMQ